MTRTLFIILSLISVKSLSQNDSFGKVLNNFKNDTLLISKLKDFQAGGIEKKVDTKSVLPEDIISAAKQYIGIPHCMGGVSRKCLDCSGLIVAVMQQFNIQVPHNSQKIARYGEIIPDKNLLKRGDLVFFVKTYKTAYVLTHVGIYLGDHQFIHTSTRRGVMISNINDPYYWGDKFVFGTRIFP
jgi:cell wall-associated NlpC family hydrolase